MPKLITPTKCLPGIGSTPNRRHKWVLIASESSRDDWNVTTHKWCSRCGSLTEFTYEKEKSSTVEKRCKEGKEFYIRIPDAVKD